MFVTRLISGIVLVAVALLTICSGGWILYGTLTIVSLIGMFELYRAVKVQKQGENLLAVVGYLGVILHYILLSLGYSEYAMMNLIIVLIAMMFVYVFSYPKYHAEQVMAAFFGVVYVGVMLSYIYQTRMIRDGAFLVWLIFLCSWGCDTCAYCVGSLLKTVEQFYSRTFHISACIMIGECQSDYKKMKEAYHLLEESMQIPNWDRKRSHVTFLVSVMKH